MAHLPNDEEIHAKYRRVYPYLGDEQIAALREHNQRFLMLAFRQIDRLTRENKWPPEVPDQIRGLSASEI